MCICVFEQKYYIFSIDGGTNPCGIVKNEEGKTPLHIAAGKGHFEILLLLLYKVGWIIYFAEALINVFYELSNVDLISM